MPCMFEDMYKIYAGEPLKIENGQIPAETYERVMTTCFPPFGEVVDYVQNSDETITLFADGTFRYLANSIEKREMDIPIVK